MSAPSLAGDKCHPPADHERTNRPPLQRRESRGPTDSNGRYKPTIRSLLITPLPYPHPWGILMASGKEFEIPKNSPQENQDEKSLLEDVVDVGVETAVEVAHGFAIGLVRLSAALLPVIVIFLIWDSDLMNLAILPLGIGILFALIYRCKKDIGDAIGAGIGIVGGGLGFLLSAVGLSDPAGYLTLAASFFSAAVPNWRLLKLVIHR
jgi:hypothetical protein